MKRFKPNFTKISSLNSFSLLKEEKETQDRAIRQCYIAAESGKGSYRFDKKL